MTEEKPGKFGYLNKILRVDLADSTVKTEDLDKDFMRKYLGGRNLALYFMLKETAPGLEPFSPDNLLIFATGALTGAPGPAICRFNAVSKSPLTGCLGASEAGGFWAPELKFAGYDAIIIKGRAEKPVYIWIHDDTVEIRDAKDVWGLGAKDAQSKIRDEVGEKRARVAIIGPAGEKLVRFANIGNELGHYNGRNGLGAVMGSKNLKAIAVRGTKKLPLFDEKKFREITRKFAKTFKEDSMGNILYEFGTTIGVGALMAYGGLPTRNWDSGVMEGGESLFCDRYNEELLIGRKGCYACPIRCKRVVKVNDDNLKVDSDYGGPEYETIAAFGSNCGIGDLKVVAKANEICNRYVMDTISLGSTISFAMKCFEEGIITLEDTGGIELTFGNGEALIEVIELVGKREGIGNLMAEGTVRMAEKLGGDSKRFLVSVKGQEAPMHDVRIKTGVAIGYATSDIGADHMVAPHDPYFTDPESSSFKSAKTLGMEEPSGLFDMTRTKAKNYAIANRFWRMLDCIGGCHFGFAPRGPMSLEDFLNMINAITGWDIDIPDLLRGGEIALHLSRIYNFREGFTKADDDLPKKFSENMADGPYKGKLGIDREQFFKLLGYFYNEIGWDEDTAFPTKEKLKEMGLEIFA